MEKTHKKGDRAKKRGDKKDSSSKTKLKKTNSREKKTKISVDNKKIKEKENKRNPTRENKNYKKNLNQVETNRKVNVKNNAKNEDSKACFLCFCCGGNEEEKMNELLIEKEIQKEKEKKRKEEEEKKRNEEEERKRNEEEERKRNEEEERKRKEEEKAREMEQLRLEKEKEKERLILLEDKQETFEQEKKGAILKKKIEFKPKLFIKKKAKLNFMGTAAAPNPPPESSCVGEPPQVKETSVSLQEGVYLLYNSENGGQLELHYSKIGKKGSGVLAYIHSKIIPYFYFEKNEGKEIIFRDVSKKMQSVYINDIKPYYECYIEFIKMKKKFNGVLYFLPSFDAQPPPKLDIIFFDSKTKKLNYVPVEKPVEFKGDYLFVIQKGLEIFRKEIHVESLLSYLNSYGALLYLS